MFSVMFTTHTESGEIGAILPDDQFLVTDVINPPLRKEQLESLQMLHYKKLVDHCWPDLSFNILDCPNPPDFFINRNREKIGVDMVALANAGRKQATAEFWGLRERLRAAYRMGRLQRCKGLLFSISFPGHKFPPARTIEGAIEELVGIFETIEIGPEVYEFLMKGDLEAHTPFPFNQEGSTSCGTIQWRVAGNVAYNPGMPHTSLLRDCGFEVRHSYKESVMQEEIEALFNRIIANHDKNAGQGIDELVIVAGGPDKFGDASLAEACIVNFIEGWEFKINAPRYIKRIVLLDWRGSLRVLYGEFGRRKTGWISRMDG